jgi:hypothetical protein
LRVVERKRKRKRRKTPTLAGAVGRLAWVDDNEPTLLMVTFCALHDVEPELEAEEEVVVAAEQGKPPQAIHLEESRAQVHLG